MLLKDKVIIVTGASKGLGVGIAESCARQGARVVLAARNRDMLENVRTRIQEGGGQALCLPCDVAKMDDLQNLVGQTVSHWGRIDGLVNNAGVNYVSGFLDVTEEDWDRVMAIDLKGSFFLSQLCARQMIKQDGDGSIVQIASVHTQASVIGAAPYDAAKHGMVGFTKAAAVELAGRGIRLNVLSPGLCGTEIWRDIVAAAPSERECWDYWKANIPAGKLITPQEIGDACVFLLSPMSSSITGANLFADHGMTSLLVSREPYASQTIRGE